MNGSRVDLTQLGKGLSEFPLDPSGGTRVDAGNVGPVNLYLATLADHIRCPLAASEAIEMLVDDEWIDSEHSRRSSDAFAE